MFKKLPSLLQFQPKYFVGSPARFHLAFLYDLVALARPASIVALGFGEGEAFFTLCQAVRESSLSCQCTAVYRRDEGEVADNSAWRDREKYCGEFYGDFARLLPDGPNAQFADAGVDLLFVNDLDSGSEIEAELSGWQAKLTARAIVLLHGTELDVR